MNAPIIVIKPYFISTATTTTNFFCFNILDIIKYKKMVILPKNFHFFHLLAILYHFFEKSQ